MPVFASFATTVLYALPAAAALLYAWFQLIAANRRLDRACEFKTKVAAEDALASFLKKNGATFPMRRGTTISKTPMIQLREKFSSVPTYLDVSTHVPSLALSTPEVKLWRIATPPRRSTKSRAFIRSQPGGSGACFAFLGLPSWESRLLERASDTRP